MEWHQYVVVWLAAFSLLSGVRSQSFLKLHNSDSSGSPQDVILGGGRKMFRVRPNSDDSYCESWKFSVENNDAGAWSTVPSRCAEFVKKYVTGHRYLSDSKFVAADSLAFAKSVSIAADGKDCWIFDIDETLLSNLPLYAAHGYGSEVTNDTSFYEWAELAIAPVLPASLRLYKEVQKLNFTIILLTGRSEPYRNCTVKNLHSVGYINWKKLLLRGKSDEGTNAIIYKSKKRKELEAEGYRIYGSSGDQWSDLLGNATAVRSFKLPNPMYFIS